MRSSVIRNRARVVSTHMQTDARPCRAGLRQIPEELMSERITMTEARQADRRKLNYRVLIISMIGLLLVGIAFAAAMAG